MFEALFQPIHLLLLFAFLVVGGVDFFAILRLLWRAGKSQRLRRDKAKRYSCDSPEALPADGHTSDSRAQRSSTALGNDARSPVQAQHSALLAVAISVDTSSSAKLSDDSSTRTDGLLTDRTSGLTDSVVVTDSRS